MHHSTIKFRTKSIEPSLCDYSDAYILVTGNITLTRTIAAGDNLQRKQPFNAATQVIFKNWAYTSGSLWNFKRDEIDDNANVTNDDNAPSFKYKSKSYWYYWNKWKKVEQK